MTKTQAITIPDVPKALHTKTKTAAAAAEITLKEWIKQAMMEKLYNDTENRCKVSK